MTKQKQKKEIPLFDTWIYPEDGSDGQIVKLKKGADCPEGFSFSPCEAPVVESTGDGDDAPDAGDREAEIAELNQQLTDANTSLQQAKEENDKLRDRVENAPSADDQRAALDKLAKEADELNAANEALKLENSTLKEEAKLFKAAAEKATEETKPAEAKTAKK